MCWTFDNGCSLKLLWWNIILEVLCSLHLVILYILFFQIIKEITSFLGVCHFMTFSRFYCIFGEATLLLYEWIAASLYNGQTWFYRTNDSQKNMRYNIQTVDLYFYENLGLIKYLLFLNVQCFHHLFGGTDAMVSTINPLYSITNI